jgi:hypothetical protein
LPDHLSGIQGGHTQRPARLRGPERRQGGKSLPSPNFAEHADGFGTDEGVWLGGEDLGQGGDRCLVARVGQRRRAFHPPR